MFSLGLRRKKIQDKKIVQEKYTDLEKELTALEVVIPHQFERGIASKYSEEPSIDDIHRDFYARLETVQDTIRSLDIYDFNEVKEMSKDFYLRLGKLSKYINEQTYGRDENLNKESTLTLESIIENKEYENSHQISYDRFLEGVEKLPSHVLKRAYAYILYKYTLDKRNKAFISKDIETSIADDLHNLPLYLGADMKGFKHDYFWASIVTNKQKKKYIMSTFTHILIRHYEEIEESQRKKELQGEG